MTDLAALSEFAGQERNLLVNRLSLMNYAETLADRNAWITIGNADERVDTDRAVAFARALVVASQARSLACGLTPHVLPVPGHSSLPKWHDDAGSWLREVVSSTFRVLPAGA